METDDKAFPKQLLLSTDQENLSPSVNRQREVEYPDTRAPYQCSLCQEIPDDPVFTCAQCVNDGQFCSSKHEACSLPQRNAFLTMLDDNACEEFQQYSSNKSVHLLCFERRFLLAKFNFEKTKLQIQLQASIKSSEEFSRVSEEVRQRRESLNRMRQSIERLKEKVELKIRLQRDSQERLRATRFRIKVIQTKSKQIKPVLQSANTELRIKIDLRTKYETNLDCVRRKYFAELNRCLFPIQRVATIDESFAARIQALFSAQQTIGDNKNIKPIETSPKPIVDDYRYKIVQSCLPRNGNYQIEKLLLTVNINSDATDPDSPQSQISRDFYEVLSALSHACQLINVVAFILHHHLPFRLHHRKFSPDSMTVDCLRANIVKLSANILNCCLSQGIPVEFDHVNHAIENLEKLMNLQSYRTRPKEIKDFEKYIDKIEGEMNKSFEITNNDISNDPSIYDIEETSPATAIVHYDQFHRLFEEENFEPFKSICPKI